MPIPQASYFLCILLKELCSTVVGVQHAKVMYKSTDLIISTEELDQLCRGADLDTSDARIVKMEMEKQGLIAVGNNDQGVKVGLDLSVCMMVELRQLILQLTSFSFVAEVEFMGLL